MVPSYVNLAFRSSFRRASARPSSPPAAHPQFSPPSPSFPLSILLLASCYTSASGASHTSSSSASSHRSPDLVVAVFTVRIRPSRLPLDCPSCAARPPLHTLPSRASAFALASSPSMGLYPCAGGAAMGRRIDVSSSEIRWGYPGDGALDCYLPATRPQHRRY